MLLNRLRNRFNLPIFENEDQSRIARFLRTVILVAQVCGVLYLILAVTTLHILPTHLFLAFAGTIYLTGLQLLLRRGLVALASNLFIGGSWLILTLSVIVGGGIQSPAFAGYIFVIISAGLLTSGRGGLIATAICILTGAGILSAQSWNLIPVFEQAPLLSYVEQSMIFIIAGAMSLYFYRDLRAALHASRGTAAELQQAHENLRASEEKYRGLFNNVPVGLYRTSPDGEIVEANTALIEMLGFQPVGSNASGLYFEPADNAAWLTESKQNTKVQSLGVRFRKIDGSILWADDYTRAIQDKDGNILYYEGSVIDATERKHAESALREAETKYRTLVENTPAVVYLNEADPESEAGYRALYVSPQLEAILGYKSEELIRDPELWSSILHPEDRERALKADAQHFASGEPLIEEYRVLARDRRVVWLRDTATIRREEPSGKTLSQGILLDITERKQAEATQSAIYQISNAAQSLPTLDELYISIHKTLGILMPVENFYIALYDAETKLLSFPYYKDQFDTAPQPEKPGRGLTEYVLRLKRPILVNPAIFERLITNNEIEEVGTKPVDWLGAPLTVGNETFGVMVIQTYSDTIRLTRKELDILAFVSTQVATAIKRKQDEEKIRESDARYRLIAQNAEDIIWTVNMNLQLTYISPSLERALGYTSQELLTIPPERLLTPASLANGIHAFTEEVKVAVPQPDPDYARTLELEYCRKDGSTFWVEMKFSFFRDVNGRPTGVVGVGRDITERKQAEEALRKAHGELEHLVQERTAELSQANMLLQTLLDYTPDHIFFKDIRSRFIRNSRSQANALGLSDPAQVVGKTDFDFFPHAQSAYADEQQIIRTGQPLANFEEFVVWPNGNKTWLLTTKVPLRDEDGRIIGTFGIARDITDRKQAEVDLQEAKQELEVSVANRTAELRETNKQLELELEVRKQTGERLKTQLERFASLRAIDTAISTSTDLRMTFYILLSQAVSRLKVDAAAILQYDIVTNSFKYGGTQGFHTPGSQNTLVRMGEGIAGRSAYERAPLEGHALTSQEFSATAPDLADEGFTCFYALPLFNKGKVTGVFEVFERNHSPHDRDWIDFLNSLAGQAAIAIDNSSLFTNLQRSNDDLRHAYETTLEGWSRALDLRDKETEGHTQRVTRLTEGIAEAMGISGQELLNIRRGALLHDIGKMGIPDRILHKRGPLTKKEWEAMRKHPEFAFDLLSPIPYLRGALDIPYCHHEKWDGSGYPRNLKGEQIPLAARIFAVVDVYDALTSDRPYRSGWSQEKTLEYIQEQSGSHFDPRLVQLFMKEMAPV